MVAPRGKRVHHERTTPITDVIMEPPVRALGHPDPRPSVAPHTSHDP